MKEITRDSIVNFDDNQFCAILNGLCPIISTVMKGAMEKYKPGHMITVYNAIYKARWKTRPSIIAHRNDQLMFAGGLKRRGFDWFNRMGFTNSYSTALRTNRLMATDYDAKAIEWKKTVEKKFEALVSDPDIKLDNVLEKLLKDQTTPEFQVRKF